MYNVCIRVKIKKLLNEIARQGQEDKSCKVCRLADKSSSKFSSSTK